MKIKLSQIGSVVYLVVLANYLGTTSGTIINMAKQDAWFSVLFAFIVGLIPIFIFIKIMDFKPDLNIAQKNVYIFGKVFGNFINILLMISTFIFLIGQLIILLGHSICIEHLLCLLDFVVLLV